MSMAVPAGSLVVRRPLLGALLVVLERAAALVALVLLVPVLVLVAVVVMMFSAASYAELSTRFPVSAGEAAYVRAGFNSIWLSTTAL